MANPNPNPDPDPDPDPYPSPNPDPNPNPMKEADAAAQAMKGAMDKQHRKELRALQEACEEHLADAAQKIKQANRANKDAIAIAAKNKELEAANAKLKVRVRVRVSPTPTPTPTLTLTPYSIRRARPSSGRRRSGARPPTPSRTRNSPQP